MVYYPSWFTLDRNNVLCFSNPPHNYVDDSDVDYPNRIVLMQYTGVKSFDKKEIYDGDILLGRDSTGGGSEAIHYTVKSVVSWDVENGKWIVTELGSGDKYDLYDYSLTDTVIGNVYQNPELLK